jgi:hypothetical protein
MAYGFIKLEWHVPRRGFKFESHTSSTPGTNAIVTGDKSSGVYIVPQGAEMRAYTADLLEHHIFLQLAMTPPHDEEAVLKFVNKWGLPTREDWTVARFARLSLDLAEAAIIAGNKGIQELAQRYPHSRRMGSIKWGFRSVPRQSAPGICFYPNNLRTFCWLELLQCFAGPTDFGQCEVCSKLVQQPKSGPLPRYCSQACSQKAYRRRLKDNGSPTRGQPKPGNKQ